MIFKHPNEHLILIINDESDSFWAYLVTKKNEIISDCWIANKSNSSLMSNEFYRKKNTPPPANDKYIAKKVTIDSVENFSVEWNDQSEEVYLSINDFKIMKFLYTQKRGYNRLLVGDCPFGNKWVIV